MKRISRWIVCQTSLTVLLCFVSLLLPVKAFGQLIGETLPPDTQSPKAASSADEVSGASESITELELKRHIEFLASDTLQGREAGMQGNYAAGAYIVDQLRKSNVSPVSSDGAYFHYFHPNFRNILAVIPGSDPQLKNEYVLLGGHYDHVGFGNRTNSRGPFGVVHNGADDNASGTAGVIEIAQALSHLSSKPRRSILIAFWDGEEKGLLGSKNYVDYPVIPLSQIRFHLNADMVGRLRPDGLEISGWQTATGCRQFLAQRNSENLKLRFMYTYKPESDHWPFFERRVPSLMLHTGKHDDYHRPSDDTHLLNLAGVRTISQFMLRCTFAAANADTLPAFRGWSKEKSEAFAQIFQRPMESQPSRLGVTYNATLAKEGTIRLTSIASGSPAHLAGLQVEDEVLAVGSETTSDAPDFRSLVMAAPMESIFEIRRAENVLNVPVTLRGNLIRFGFRWIMNAAEPRSAIVTHVAGETPAATCGLKPQHRITSVGGKKFETLAEFQNLLIDTKPPFSIGAEFMGRVESLTINLLTEASEEFVPPEELRPDDRDKK